MNTMPIKPGAISWQVVLAGLMVGLILGIAGAWQYERTHKAAIPVNTAGSAVQPDDEVLAPVPETMKTVIQTTPKATNSVLAPAPTYPFHYYDDATTDLSNVHIIGVVFVIQDKNAVKSEWNTNGPDMLNEVKNFYEREFQQKTTIDYEWISEPIISSLGENPDAFQIGIDVKKQLKSHEKENEFNSYIIFIADNENLSGNMSGYRGVATCNPYWLNNPVSVIENGVATMPEKAWDGIINTAHEFGHTLGLPHPWEMSENSGDQGLYTVPDDVMAYGDQTKLTLPDMYVRGDMKKHLGL